ncbi:non-canonical purine NTP pyrophosphatase, rdgB/HAM1 family protein [Halovivax asiaticus JCM 14624]|uniref:Non-canonical purine NTP pyrophosphatase, rdgB/HAM1 family protein n=1 Tax=Halovivax asiaticus JCM 14624 TaxID=1227490 RepID=M0BDB7_9EURY|nr:RdgB/HAM1 family non-canonical purine NTP pyrophosphatase [Halovivax asiaticus]ELZ08896.1 non-canonical purine NTP pyrophosphatase, rdgB/HAM1 family protein [Halovivax asiaticus JCM 14624]
MSLRFVTGNEGKVREARAYFDGIGDVEQVAYDYAEIQASDLETIASRGAVEAYRELDGTEPLFVEDSGLAIEALGGFPGPYSAYVEDTLGIERVWNLAADEANRRARFESVIAYVDGDPADPDVETFTGTVAGTIVAPRGEGGFGYDPIFAYNGTTMAEMEPAEKNAISHRGRAFATFAEWLADDD